MSGTLDVIAAAGAQHRLQIFGAFHCEQGDGLPDGVGTLILLGPQGAGFWEHFTTTPEYLDGQPDSIDRWSTRVISGLATSIDGQAFFPFGGPPYQPFISWALRSGRAWQSPVNMLVHDTAGLFVSYRGAIGVADRLPLDPPPACPCKNCPERPCASACPAGAVREGDYDVAGCHEFLDQPAGQDCMTQGCVVRRSCPVSQRYQRNPAQSAFHMRAFHK